MEITKKAPICAETEAAEKSIHTIATAHLDTVWNWDFEATIDRCILRTLKWNFALFEKYPEYVFNFEGAYRYELIEEYYPKLFAKLKKYVKEGRWYPCGSAYENGDVNVPSPEALFRNFLYGNEYYDKTFGMRSKDVFLPDCFGFGYALPAIANHANLYGFTTQKLSWGSAYGIPFDIGKWYGPNGKYILASLDMHNYFSVLSNLRAKNFIKGKLERNSLYGLNATEVFHGIGDRGGSPLPVSVKNVCADIRRNPQSDVKVYSSTADGLFRQIMTDMTAEQREKLPSWSNELLLTNHGTGGYTSRAISKRWNRRGEELADMAERAAVTALWLNAADYPKRQLDKCWKRIIAHQFHDDLPGTSIQRVYPRTWNDYGMSLNQLSHEYEQSLRAVSSMLDTSFCKGTAVVVNNPLETARHGCVSAILDGEYKFIRVFTADKNEVPSQVLCTQDGKTAVAFYAELKGLACRVFDITGSDEPCRLKSSLKATDDTLENERYLVTLDNNGDIRQIEDKLLKKPLLKQPIILGLLDYTGSKIYPAWELKYNESIREPQQKATYVSSELIENGPARVSVRVVQQAKDSVFVNVISLAAGSDFVEVHSEFEWNSLRTLLKNKFSFTASNEKATFDLGLGAIERGNARPEMYEVPAQKWADITDESGEFGVSVLSSCKYGWDKYDNNTLRLTVLHTPLNNSRTTSMQSMMDLGLNRYSYAVCAHKGAELSRVQAAAREFSSPLTAFVTSAHKGSLGSEFSFGEISDGSVIIRAIKKAENSNEIIVRVNDGANKAHHGVTLRLGAGIKAAREIFASEEPIGAAQVKDGCLVFDLEPYDVKSFALTLSPCRKKAAKIPQHSVTMPYNIKAFSSNENPGDGKIGYMGCALPAEITPAVITSGGIDFMLGDKWGKVPNATTACGQTVQLDESCNKLYLLAASQGGDKDYTFLLDGEPVTVKISDIREKPFRWDLYSMKQTAKIKTDVLAHEVTHTHSDKGDNTAHQLFMFKYVLDTNAAKQLKLPHDSDLFILAATQTKENNFFHCVTPLYDMVEERDFDFHFKGASELLNYEFRKALGLAWMIG